jgi:hypothetical protein
MTPSRALLARSRCSERGSRVVSTRCSVLPANSTARLNGERGARSIKRNSSSVHTVGVILMIVGVVGLVLSLVFWAAMGSWYPGRTRTTTRTEDCSDGHCMA